MERYATRLELSDRPQRGLEERLLLFLPGLTRVAAAYLWRLPPRSRLRRLITHRLVQRSLEALNRKDFAVGFAMYAPEVELATDRQLVQVGFEERYRGLPERIAFHERWLSEWGDFHFVPSVLVDLGDRLFIEGRVLGAGASSGAAMDNYWAALVTLDAGRVTREEFYFQKPPALEAAGLSEPTGAASARP